jgi:hypothetical protein
MTSRDIPILLAIFICVLAATVLTWWLSMKAIEYFTRIAVLGSPLKIRL